MSAIGIFYGSSTGNTKDVSVKLHALLGGDLYDITEVDADTIAGYENLVFAASTWGAGDLQDDWEDFFPNLDEVDFKGKKVGIMGLGDQVNYGDTFVDGMAVLAEKIEELGGAVVGFTSADGYEYDNTESRRGGQFIGLVIDEDNQSDKTDGRIKSWAATLSKEFT